MHQIANYQDVMRNLYDVGYEPQATEVLVAIGEAVRMLWSSDVGVELPAVSVVVEELLFGTDRIHRDIAEDYSYGYNGH